jgi:hypothetical protein
MDKGTLLLPVALCAVGMRKRMVVDVVFWILGSILVRVFKGVEFHKLISDKIGVRRIP